MRLMDKLKPCPFCGGEAKIVKDNNDAPFEWAVECMECQTTSGLAMSKKHAELIWNSRVTQKKSPLTLEQIASEYLNLCDHDCAGDNSVGIQECPFWQPADINCNGEFIPYVCELENLTRNPEQEADHE